MDVNWSARSELARALAISAGERLRKAFDGYEEIRIVRPGQDPQTIQDLRSDKYIREEILRQFPTDSILSEEYTKVHARDTLNNEVDYLWIVDPCDGTVNFISGLPLFSVSIAIYYRGCPLLSVVHDPIRDELFYAEHSGGASLNSQKILCSSSIENLNNATLGIDISHDSKSLCRNLGILKLLSPKVRAVRSFYSGALELCYIAIGRIDIRIDDSYYPWDVAAGALIAVESGACITDLEGHDWSLRSSTLLAASESLHSKVLLTLSEKL